MSTIYRNLESSYNGTADTSWYDVYAAEDSSETEFVIATNADLYGFASLAASNNFAGKTVYVVADIDANGAKYSWTPISTSDKPFNGTLDGQGHTISNISQADLVSKCAGLFGSTEVDSIIRNLRVTDSTFTYPGSGNNGWMGTIVGLANGGTFQNIYSNADLSSGAWGTGGIVGVMTKNVIVSNCWFDGDISLNGRDCGGVVDEVVNSRVTLKHCLFSGNIYSSHNVGGTRTAGIIGRADKTSTIVLSDTLVSGMIYCDKKKNRLRL